MSKNRRRGRGFGGQQADTSVQDWWNYLMETPSERRALCLDVVDKLPQNVPTVQHELEKSLENGGAPSPELFTVVTAIMTGVMA
jgi:hypothetical protein